MNKDDVLIEKLGSASKLIVFTGAGVSVASGVSSFRDPGGLWDKFNPEDLATEQAFRKNPKLVWSWYQWRRKQIIKSRPNPAHIAIKELSDLFEGFCLVTQNVDQLHEEAGSSEVLHLHGNIFENKCIDCTLLSTENHIESVEPVMCRACQSYLRPNVVWFGEALPEEELTKAFFCAGQSDVLLSIGTGAAVQPAASVIHVAKQAGAFLAEFNTNESLASNSMDLCFTEKVEISLPRILSKLN